MDEEKQKNAEEILVMFRKMAMDISIVTAANAIALGALRIIEKKLNYLDKVKIECPEKEALDVVRVAHHEIMDLLKKGEQNASYKFFKEIMKSQREKEIS